MKEAPLLLEKQKKSILRRLLFALKKSEADVQGEQMSENKAEPKAAPAAQVPQERKLTIGCFISFFMAIILFAGIFNKMPDGWKWLQALDFSTLVGAFGKIAGAGTFMGSGGIGARAGFLFGLSLVPGVMLALGLIEVLAHYGALRAAQFLLTPFLKPVLGLSGNTGLALITDLQSTDAGAGLTKGLFDNGIIRKKDLVVMCAWQYAGAGCISNYLTTVVGGLIAFFLVPIWVPLVVMLILKFFGGFLVRMVLSTVYRKDFANE